MAAAGRPQLRGLLKGQLLRHVIAVSGLSVITVGLAKHFLKDARIKAYEDFYKNYDAEKDFERMRDAGVFRSVKPAK